MRIVGFVQARIGSTRLPQKVMLDIVGKPMVWHVWKRVASARLLDEAVILTSSQSGNERITEFAAREGIPVYAGSESDLLQRYYDGARFFRADVLVRVTADCPLIDPALVDDLIRAFREAPGALDYLANSRPQATYPHGLDAELFTFQALEKAHREVTDPFRREWLTTNFFEHPEQYRQKNLRSAADLSHLRLTVDYPEDLENIRTIYEALGRTNPVFGLQEILDYLQSQPALLESCTSVKRHESYSEELAKKGRT